MLLSFIDFYTSPFYLLLGFYIMFSVVLDFLNINFDHLTPVSSHTYKYPTFNTEKYTRNALLRDDGSSSHA